MNILGCLDQPSSGDYWFNGQAVAQMSGDELARLRRDAFGFVFQQYHLLKGHRRQRQCAAARALYPTAAFRAQAAGAQLLSQLGLPSASSTGPANSPAASSSGYPSPALMNGGQIILADEPTGALDSRSGGR